MNSSTYKPLEDWSKYASDKAKKKYPLGPNWIALSAYNIVPDDLLGKEAIEFINKLVENDSN